MKSENKIITEHLTSVAILQNIQPIVKNGGGSVMLCGCMSYNEVRNLAFIEGIMNAQMYIDVLRNNLKQSVIKLGIQEIFQFQQDNYPKHMAKKHESGFFKTDTNSFLHHLNPQTLI